jgi:hypothetical protein
MNKEELKEQLQQDIFSILEGFGISEAMDANDFDRMSSVIGDTIIANVNKLK